MPLYRYKAATVGGELLEGEMEVPDRASAIARIQELGQIPISAERTGDGFFDFDAARLFSRKKISSEEAASFTQSLASLLEARIPLDGALQIMTDVEERANLRELVNAIQKEIRGGAPLSAALESHGKAFSSFYIGMVESAEASGRLDEGLSRLAEHLENSMQLRNQVVSSLLYPTILVLVSAVSLVLILTYVVPQFEPMFEDLGDALPQSTRVVLASAAVVKSYGAWAIAGLAALSLYARFILTKPRVRLRWDRFVLRAVLIGPILARLATAQFARTLGTLLKGGVPLLDGLAIAKQTIGNQALVENVDDAMVHLKSGGMLADTLIASGRFPSLALRMIKVGEQTGHLDEMLLRVADTYDREVGIALKRALQILEPVLIVGLGIMIAGIILSILVGIISVNDIPLS